MIHRPKGEPPRKKVSQLEEDVIYILCPDKSCNKFFDDSYTYVPCTMHCPKMDDLEYLVSCKVCTEPVILPKTFNSWQRVDHQCDQHKITGGVASSFMSGNKHEIMYELPLKD